MFLLLVQGDRSVSVMSRRRTTFLASLPHRLRRAPGDVRQTCDGGPGLDEYVDVCGVALSYHIISSE